MTDFLTEKGLPIGILGMTCFLVACDDSSSPRTQRREWAQPARERPAEWSDGRLAGAVGDTVMISEFMTLNVSGPRDGEGKTADWIEIWNYGDESVDLTGWSLTDDPERPKQWRFPAGILAGGQRGLVWASELEANGGSPAGNREWHCSFQLSGDGEYLALADASGNVVHEFRPGYPPQRSNVSYGVSPEWRVGDPLAGRVGFLENPTPAAANSARLVGAIGRLAVDHEAGWFPDTIAVALSIQHSDTTIRYTLDGSSPDDDRAAVYDQPLVLDTSRVIRARAFREGFLPSPEFVGTYEIGLRSDAARLALSYSGRTDREPVGDRVVALESGGAAGFSEVIWGEISEAGEAFRISVSNRARSAPALRALLKGIGAVRCDAFELHPVSAAGPPAWRAGYLREDFLRRLQGDWGNPYLRDVPYRLVVNAQDLGRYCLVECGEARYGAEYLGGKRAEYDVVTGGAEYLSDSSGLPGAVVLAGDGAAWERLWDLEAGDSLIESGLLDVGSFIDLMMLDQLRRPSEGERLRAWIALRRQGSTAGFQFLVAPPLERLWQKPEAVLESGGRPLLATLWARCLESEVFRFRVRDRVHQLLFDPGEPTAARLLPAEIVKAHGLEPNPERLEAVSRVRSRLEAWLRAQDLVSPLGGVAWHPSKGPVAPDSEITLSANGREIVYTLDGSDPRRPDGAESSQARVYRGPILLDQPRTLSARVRMGTNWGPLSRRAFDVSSDVL